MAPESTPVQQLRLPFVALGLVEVRRMKRELESVEEFVRQTEIRAAGKQAALPRTSRLLESLATENSQQLLKPEARKLLVEFLNTVEHSAPRIHMSFAVEAAPSFTVKVVEWLRANIHPYALLEIGLQPTIAAGCIVRTSNKVFDFSLRHRFAEAQQLLVQSLEEIAQPTAAAATVSIPASAGSTAEPTT